MSSYPGTVTSIDDFLITGNNMLVTETTNPIYNLTLYYENIKPETLFVWQRMLVSSRLASDSKVWTDAFQNHNSGTDNNQFIILDLKKVDTINKKIEDNALWIIEQIPGEFISQDVTQYLRFGYWPSYNVPFSQYFREKTCVNYYISKFKELRDRLDYNTCSRANIFRRNQNEINNISDIKNMLRFNDYNYDPLSKQNPGNAICGRSDLSSKSSKCSGCTDSKVSSLIDFVLHRKLYIINSPAYSQSIKPFDIKNNLCNVGNEQTFKGFPEQLAFDWIEIQLKFFDR